MKKGKLFLVQPIAKGIKLEKFENKIQPKIVQPIFPNQKDIQNEDITTIVDENEMTYQIDQNLTEEDQNQQ